MSISTSFSVKKGFFFYILALLLSTFLSVATFADSQLPSISTPTAGSTLAGATQTFIWSANNDTEDDDDESQITEWWLYAGSVKGLHDYYDSGSLGTTTNTVVTGLPIDGSIVHIRLWYKETGNWKYVDTTYTAASAGGLPAISTPTVGSILTGVTQNFIWDANNTSVTEWWLYAGSAKGLYDFYNSGSLGAATSTTVSGLPVNSSTIYVRLWYKTAGIWKFVDTTYISANLSGLPTISTPIAGSTLTGSTQSFSWNANSSNVTEWWLYAGNSLGTHNYYDSGSLGTVTSTVVTGLPTDGSTIYIRLWYQENGLWKKIDITYTAFSGIALTGSFKVLAANDLGMHCADKDYRIMSILPPFNVVHAQVVQRGTANSSPRILSDQEAEVLYSAASNPNDPAGANSINTTSSNNASVFKTNFWEQIDGGKTLGGAGYSSLYPASVLDLFEPIATDVGLPVPDPVALPTLLAAQQKMPGISNPYTANVPQKFDRYDSTLPFFANFPFGTTVQGANWFAADGIPLFPVDDLGRENAYPLMKVAARDKTGQELASVDVVLPVASEADCQNCHADPDDFGNGAATSFASVNFNVIREANAPGPEKLQNAAKINILRVHDAKHGAKYTSSIDGSPAICDSTADANDPDCLANQTPIQCSQCHYTPALDLAQVGPIDEPAAGIKGRQQTRHITMSRAMHFTHSSYQLNGTPLFPEMPAPNDPQRTSGTPVNNFERNILGQTCYQCHPGKRTQCLRGAMFTGGVVCQDCHGNMTQVGDDFSEGLATGTGLDLAKRVPWASEPKCQSCHTGDALNPNHPAGALVSGDGLRLSQAYLPNDASATPINSPSSRFAENQSLYRISGNDDNSGKGHGGVMCEGCHGSTHAIWPTPFAGSNDNIAAKQIQGHSGSITECTSCHEDGSLGITLGGPHGMHPVGGTQFADGGHEDLAENNPDACRTCHGQNGEGTVLSRTSTDRSFVIEECENGTLCPNQEVNNFRVNLNKGTQVSCVMCHDNEL